METHLLKTLWGLWVNHTLKPHQIIKAVSSYGYELSYLTKQGIGVEKQGTKIQVP